MSLERNDNTTKKTPCRMMQHEYDACLALNGIVKHIFGASNGDGWVDEKDLTILLIQME